MKLIGKISLAVNFLFICAFFAKRLYYTHSGPAQDDQKVYFDMWNRGRQSVLEPLPIDSGDIVFVGNSITEGFPLEEMFHSLKIKNRGISGNRSCHILGRIGSIARARPAKIFLEAGVNDILNDVPLDTLKVYYQIILNNIWEVSPSTKIYVQSVFPLGGAHAAKEKTVEAFNSWLKDFCKGADIEYIDIFPLLLQDGALDPDYSLDGIHLTGPGYSVWKDKIQPYL